MAKTATYWTDVRWDGEHWGHVTLGNGPQMPFSAPPDAYGHEGVLTPEDAFVAAANTCVMMMFLWACERFKIDLVSYTCHVEGVKRIELDRTEIFTHLRFYPQITARGTDEKRVQRALESAQKYSLVANSVKSEVIIEPKIIMIEAPAATTATKWKPMHARPWSRWAWTPLSKRSPITPGLRAMACCIRRVLSSTKSW